jgi:hypothetical protein
MSNLRRLIKEFVGLEASNLLEGSITIPEEILARSDDLHDFINEREDDIMSEIYPDIDNVDFQTGKPAAEHDAYNPLVLPELSSFFQFISKHGADVSVGVGFFGNDGVYAEMDVKNDLLLINMDFWDTKFKKSREAFRQLIDHELVHASDPFVRHPSYKRYREKLKRGSLKVDPQVGLSPRYQNYAKSQTEYAAYSSGIISDLKPIVGDDSRKISSAIKIISQVAQLPPAEQTMNNKVLAKYPGSISLDEYKEILAIAKKPEIKAWSTRPTLFRKFLGDLAIGLGK